MLSITIRFNHQLFPIIYKLNFYFILLILYISVGDL